MRNSDPGVSVVSVQRHNSDLNSILTVQITGCNFQYGPNFGVSLDASSSLGRVYSRQATVLNCVRSPVSLVMKYCPFSTTLRNLASIRNLLNLSCCESLSIRSSYRCNSLFHSCFNEIFGGGRGDMYAFSFKTSPVFNLTTFGRQ